MTEKQIFAVKCAYLDLLGALEGYESGNYRDHDWHAHRMSIEDLEREFPFLSELDTSKDEEE